MNFGGSTDIQSILANPGEKHNFLLTISLLEKRLAKLVAACHWPVLDHEVIFVPIPLTSQSHVSNPKPRRGSVPLKWEEEREILSFHQRKGKGLKAANSKYLPLKVLSQEFACQAWVGQRPSLWPRRSHQPLHAAWHPQARALATQGKRQIWKVLRIRTL